MSQTVNAIPAAGPVSRRERLLRGALRLLGSCALLGIFVQPLRGQAQPLLSILADSRVLVQGTDIAIEPRDLPISTAPVPWSFALNQPIVFPHFALSFGQSIDVFQVGQALGAFDRNSGRVDLSITIRIQDSDGNSVDIPSTFTTEEVSGISKSGVPVCILGYPSDPVFCQGTRWNPGTGELRWVSFLKMPVGAGLLLEDGEHVIFEIRAHMDIGDTDGDGFTDVSDNCPLVFNVDQLDRDADGIGDVCDNCRDVSNANQLDQDDDGLGDVCDICPLDPSNDFDGDGVCNDEVPPPPPVIINSYFNVQAGSVAKLDGDSAAMPLQSILIARDPGASAFQLTTPLGFTPISLGLGQSIGLVQVGSAHGTFVGATGEVTFSAYSLRVTDSGVSTTIVKPLTTEAVTGTRNGVQLCNGTPSDPAFCHGTRRNSVTGDLRLVGIFTIPAGTGTSIDRKGYRPRASRPTSHPGTPTPTPSRTSSTTAQPSRTRTAGHGVGRR